MIIHSIKSSRSWIRPVLAALFAFLVVYAIIFAIANTGRFHLVKNAFAEDGACIPGVHVIYASPIASYDEIKKGDVILFRTKNIPGYEDGIVFAKFVRGLEGDKVEIKPNLGVFVEGELISSSLVHGKGHESELEVRGKVDKNKVWVMAPSDLSYDSRYYGAIDFSQVTGIAKFMF